MSGGQVLPHFIRPTRNGLSTNARIFQGTFQRWKTDLELLLVKPDSTGNADEVMTGANAEILKKEPIWLTIFWSYLDDGAARR